MKTASRPSRGVTARWGDPAFFAKLVANEADFRKKVNAKPALKKAYSGVWGEIAKLSRRNREMRKEFGALETLSGGDLLRIAKTLVRYGDETAKPNPERLREYTDSRLPQVKSRLLSNAPIIEELEVVRLSFALTKMREDLGPDHPAVKKIFGTKAPEELAASLVKNTKVGQLTVSADGKISGLRNELFTGGKAKIDASKDPMIEFVRTFDADARAIRAKFEAEVDGPLKKQQELLAKARFEVYGTSIYPDATFSLRLSYGSVKGYRSALGQDVKPVTVLAGAFERNTGADPFALPKSWLDAKSKLALETPFNVATTNDIIGGNSGSPMFNQKGEIVGLIFDGNIESLGGDYGFDEANNRAIAVHSAALVEALDKIYGQKRLVDELKGIGASGAATKAGQP